MKRKTLRLSVVEGALWAFMVGLGELFFVADAVRLGADRVFAAAVVIVPLLAGALAGLAGLGALDLVRHRRHLVVVAVVGQVAVLLGMAALELLHASSPSTVLAGACSYYAFGNAAAPAWSSWMGQLVPRRLRGRYFGRRNRWIHLCTFLGLGLGGAVLGTTAAVEVPVAYGFATVFGLAAVARIASGVLLWISSEPDFEPPGPEGGLVAVARRGLPPEARRVVRTSTWILLAVSIASPFFAPYMLIDLGFDNVQYTLAQAAMVLGKVLSLPYFGARVDRSGVALPWRLGAMGIAIVPLPWLLAGSLPTVAGCQALSGASWGAYEVANLSLLLGSTSDRLRAAVFALQGLFSALAMAAGSLIGWALLGSGVPIVLVFVASSMVRLVVVATQWSLPRQVPARSDVVRMLGLRPQAGPGTGPIGPPRTRAPS